MLINNGNNYTSVNDYSDIPFIPYKIIQYLLSNTSESAEMFWKLLKYQTIDALDEDNLTITEKKNLIWTGQTDQQNYVVFLKPLIGNSLDTSEEQMKIHLYRVELSGEDLITGIANYEIDTIVQEKCANVKYKGMLVERTDLIESCLLSLLSGIDIGIGIMLQFNRQLSRACKSMMNISNSKSFYGRSVIFSTKIISPSNAGGCR